MCFVSYDCKNCTSVCINRYLPFFLHMSAEVQNMQHAKSHLVHYIHTYYTYILHILNLGFVKSCVHLCLCCCAAEYACVCWKRRQVPNRSVDRLKKHQRVWQRQCSWPHWRWSTFEQKKKGPSALFTSVLAMLIVCLWHQGRFAHNHTHSLTHTQM